MLWHVFPALSNPRAELWSLVKSMLMRSFCHSSGIAARIMNTWNKGDENISEDSKENSKLQVEFDLPWYTSDSSHCPNVDDYLDTI